MYTAKDIGNVVRALTDCRAYQAVRFLSEREVIRATMPRRRKGNPWDKRDCRRTMVLTIGRPNAREVKFLKLCKKAGEPLPLKRIQIRDFPKPR